MRTGGSRAAHDLPGQAQEPQLVRRETFLDPRQQGILLVADILVQSASKAPQHLLSFPIVDRETLQPSGEVVDLLVLLLDAQRQCRTIGQQPTKDWPQHSL